MRHPLPLIAAALLALTACAGEPCGLGTPADLAPGAWVALPGGYVVELAEDGAAYTDADSTNLGWGVLGDCLEVYDHNDRADVGGLTPGLWCPQEPVHNGYRIEVAPNEGADYGMILLPYTAPQGPEVTP
jgi:hypothetical protein